jgi:hypothetical protein
MREQKQKSEPNQQCRHGSLVPERRSGRGSTATFVAPDRLLRASPPMAVRPSLR